MFDMGFSELVLIAVVALLVIGPERLPSTIRTATLWLNRLKRGFNDIKREVQQELHNDAVMQDLRKTGEQLKAQANSIGQGLQDQLDEATASQAEPALDTTKPGAETTRPAEPGKE